MSEYSGKLKVIGYRVDSLVSSITRLYYIHNRLFDSTQTTRYKQNILLKTNEARIKEDHSTI